MVVGRIESSDPHAFRTANLMDGPIAVDFQTFAARDFQAAVAEPRQFPHVGVPIGRVSAFAVRMAVQFIRLAIHVSVFDTSVYEPNREVVGMKSNSCPASRGSRPS